MREDRGGLSHGLGDSFVAALYAGREALSRQGVGRRHNERGVVTLVGRQAVECSQRDSRHAVVTWGSPTLGFLEEGTCRSNKQYLDSCGMAAADDLGLSAGMHA